MKQNRSNLFIVVSSIALTVVLLIQMNSIFQAAQIKESLFNEKANMVLARATEALYSDKALCRQMENSVGKNEIHKIDSLLTHYMNFYNFHIGYSFQVLKTRLPSASNGNGLSTDIYTEQVGCYRKGLDDLSAKTGWELKLIFPEKKQFILAEMKNLFIASVILILIVFIMFRLTIRSLLQEKRISEHTTDFLNNMTHEFKTPLTNIALAGKMLVKDSNIRQEEKIKHYSGIILEENEKLRLQVEQVLSMTALERGEIPLQKREIDFHLLIRDAANSMSIQIEHKQGKLQLNPEAESFVVEGDKTHLANALCNLIDNAIKYSVEKPELSICTLNSGGNLIVIVSDKGIGIDKEYQKQVFDMFFRVPTGNLHDVKGFGLGLAYIKKIVELHGGAITLQSEKGNGSSFTITLPHV